MACLAAPCRPLQPIGICPSDRPGLDWSINPPVGFVTDREDSRDSIQTVTSSPLPRPYPRLPGAPANQNADSWRQEMWLAERSLLGQTAGPSRGHAQCRREIRYTPGNGLYTFLYRVAKWFFELGILLFFFRLQEIPYGYECLSAF